MPMLKFPIPMTQWHSHNLILITSYLIGPRGPWSCWTSRCTGVRCGCQRALELAPVPPCSSWRACGRVLLGHERVHVHAERRRGVIVLHRAAAAGGSVGGRSLVHVQIEERLGGIIATPIKSFPCPYKRFRNTYIVGGIIVISIKSYPIRIVVQEHPGHITVTPIKSF